MSLDFSLRKYERFCETIKSQGCPVMTVMEFLEMGQPHHFLVVLRHDVDRDLASAIRMAQLEARHGIRATYYVRMTRQVYKPSQIRVISRLGHEVGYHYEVLAKAKGDMARAISLFDDELQRLRQVVPVRTISMHGGPLSPWNNLDLWQTYDYKNYDLGGEFCMSIDHAKLYYFTDTGRSWDSEKYNLRDHVDSKSPPQKIESTEDLMVFLKGGCDCPVFINAHPNRWSPGYASYLSNTLVDWLANQAKWVINRLQKERR